MIMVVVMVFGGDDNGCDGGSFGLQWYFIHFATLCMHVTTHIQWVRTH